MAEPSPTADLLQVTGLRVRFPVRAGLLKRVTGHVSAVGDVSFGIPRGKTFGLVGESGSGKTTIGRAILRLLPADVDVEGSILFDGTPILELGSGPLRRIRRRIQIVFQDPYGSLNPHMRVKELIGDPLKIHGLFAGRAERETRVRELLQLVGLDPRVQSRYPHAFSGGQRQRIAIARALAVDPDFVVCDEAVTSLDVSVQAQILNVLAALQDRLSLTYLFIAHDLAVVRHMCDQIAVMYLGKFVEVGDVAAIYGASAHPYTRSLLSAIPTVKAEKVPRRRIVLTGDIPSPMAPPSGCRFHTRCWLFQNLNRPSDCQTTEPELRPMPGGTSAACHHAEELALTS